MQRLFHIFLALAAPLFLPAYNVRLQILLLQIQMLKGRLKGDRLVATPEERSELLRLGALLEHDVSGLLLAIKPETYRRWRSQQGRGESAKPAGGKGIAREVRELIGRLASENLAWGYRRIAGELKKLGHKVAASSVRRILAAQDIHPSPLKGGSPPLSGWTQFVHAHMETLIACDFFTKPIYTWKGKVEAYVLIFIALGSPKDYCSAPTEHPDSAWVTQQARNASMWLAEEGIKPEMLIHDADTKFSKSFKSVWTGQGVQCKQIAHGAPMQNAFAENFIGTIKRECLNHFYCFSLDHLDHIVKVWLKHYHASRPHRGFDIGNRVLDEQFKVQPVGPVQCRQQLGGLIKDYYREAA